MLSTIKDLIADHQSGMSEFQLDQFVTSRADYGGGGTTYGRYKQSLRELWKRWRGLKGLYPERAILLLDIEELEIQSHRWLCRSITRRRAKVELTQKQLHLVELGKSIEDTEREFRRFYAQASALKKEIGELTPERRDQLDREMWAHNLKAAAALELITTGRVGHNTVMFVQAGPKEWRVPLLQEVLGGPKANEKLIGWFVNHEQGFQLPPPAAEPADVRRLLE